MSSEKIKEEMENFFSSQVGAGGEQWLSLSKGTMVLYWAENKIILPMPGRKRKI